MKIAAAKCAFYEIRTSRDTWYIADPDIQLMTNERIPVSPSQWYTDLPWGLLHPLVRITPLRPQKWTTGNLAKPLEYPPQTSPKVDAHLHLHNTPRPLRL